MRELDGGGGAHCLPGLGKRTDEPGLLGFLGFLGVPAGILVGDRKSEWLGLRVMRRANRFLISSDV